MQAPHGPNGAESNGHETNKPQKTLKPSAAPPIYVVAGGGRRPREAGELDGRLREANKPQELMQLVASHLPRFDIGNLVVAFTSAAKFEEGCDMHPSWSGLLERLLDSDVAKACWAFAKLRFVEEPSARSFWQAMVEPASRRIPGARFVDVSMICWAFAATDQVSPAVFEAASLETRSIVHELPPRSLAGVAWAFARARHHDAGLYQLLARRSGEVLSEFTAHDAASFCWGFATAEMPHTQLFEQLAIHLNQPGERNASPLRRLSAPLAAELCWAFAAASIQVPQAFATLAEVCMSNMEMLETEDVVGFAWAFATARLDNPTVFRAIADYAERFAGRFRHAELQVLAWALQSSGCSLGPCFAAAAGRSPYLSG
ncbi:hypothetical protein AK812_SmicGene12457 [Symbiodinium microadriaticum]|uniref:Tbc2 translation factor, chloroplastic n=1 Tax=Symbiodinium microadriaticum TaxID=2951 RepID=A0A1Q9EAL7_SYMMI|nr:hypothetical protein AK812_SmicGene12457 [Symbiodinium microadriaticum]